MHPASFNGGEIKQLLDRACLNFITNSLVCTCNDVCIFFFYVISAAIHSLLQTIYTFHMSVKHDNIFAHLY